MAAQIQDTIREEANRRYGPEGWRTVSLVFVLRNGTEIVHVPHTTAAPPDEPAPAAVVGE